MSHWQWTLVDCEQYELQQTHVVCCPGSRWSRFPPHSCNSTKALLFAYIVEKSGRIGSLVYPLFGYITKSTLRFKFACCHQCVQRSLAVSGLCGLVNVGSNEVDRVRPVDLIAAHIDSVLCVLKHHAVWQSLWNTTIVPPWQSRLTRCTDTVHDAGQSVSHSWPVLLLRHTQHNSQPCTNYTQQIIIIIIMTQIRKVQQMC